MLEIALLAMTLAAALFSLFLGIGFARSYRAIGTLGIDLGNSRRGQEHPLDPTAAKATAARLSVVMPARNESRDIEQAIDSILAQHGVLVELVVINDHSTDETGEIVDRLAAVDSRVQPLHNPPLVPGWFGKANAMQHGWQATEAEWVLFTDADVIHHPTCFATALETLTAQTLDFLSLLPELQCESFWENALLPHSFIGGSVKFLPPGINKPDSQRAAAAGAFILTKRSVLDQIGGLEPVRQEMLDDMCLAQVVKDHGFRTRIHFAPQLLTVRLFKSNHDCFWGSTKNILSAVDQVWKAFPLMFLPILVYWIPLATFAVGVWQGRWDLAVAGGATYALQAALIWLVLPFCQLRYRWVWFFPLSAIPVICCLSLALYHRLFAGSVAWRGRVIPLSDP